MNSTQIFIMEGELARICVNITGQVTSPVRVTLNIFIGNSKQYFLYRTLHISIHYHFTASSQYFEFIFQSFNFQPFEYCPPFQQTKCYMVSTIHDDIFEFNETFTVRLSTNSANQVIISERNESTLIIVDDDGELLMSELSLYHIVCRCYYFID